MVSTISIYTYEKIDNNCECFKAVPAPLLRQNGQSLSGYMNNMQLYHVIQAPRIHMQYHVIQFLLPDIKQQYAMISYDVILYQTYNSISYDKIL